MGERSLGHLVLKEVLHRLENFHLFSRERASGLDYFLAGHISQAFRKAIKQPWIDPWDEERFRATPEQIRAFALDELHKLEKGPSSFNTKYPPLSSVYIFFDTEYSERLLNLGQEEYQRLRGVIDEIVDVVFTVPILKMNYKPHPKSACGL